MVSAATVGKHVEKSYLVYTINPELLESRMSRNFGRQGSHADQNDSGLHIDTQAELCEIAKVANSYDTSQCLYKHLSPPL